MRLVVETIVSLGILCLTVSGRAEEVVTCKSPDGRFALRCVYADKQPYNGEATIIDLATHKGVLSLNPNWTLGHVKLLWSPDSQRVAYFFENENGYATRIFFRRNDALNEIAMPELPTPKLPKNATASGPNTNTRIEPMKWNGSDELLLEKELVNPDWGRGAMKITLGFDENHSPSVRKTEEARVSIIDYFLLLPRENFEAPLSAWLRKMRGHGNFFPCKDPTDDTVDERNGYMRCHGDGAQPSFEVALFRHRDGRPLLAVCSGELEGADSVQLQFYDLGADKKMHEAKRSIFPIPDSNEDRWEFVLPREGRTILVRSPKTRKIQHRISWEGERFAEQK